MFLHHLTDLLEIQQLTSITTCPESSRATTVAFSADFCRRRLLLDQHPCRRARSPRRRLPCRSNGTQGAVRSRGTGQRPCRRARSPPRCFSPRKRIRMVRLVFIRMVRVVFISPQQRIHCAAPLKPQRRLGAATIARQPCAEIEPGRLGPGRVRAAADRRPVASESANRRAAHQRPRLAKSARPGPPPRSRPRRALRPGPNHVPVSRAHPSRRPAGRRLG